MLGKDEFKLHGIGQLLVVEKLLEKTKAIEFYKLAFAEKISFIQYIAKNNILSALQIAHTVAQNFGVPVVDLDCIDINLLPKSLVSDKLIQRHSIIPLFYRGTNLYLATDDPSNHTSLKEIQFHTGLNTHAIVVETDKLHSLIDYLLSIKENHGLLDYISDTNEFDDFIIKEEEKHEVSAASSFLVDDAPIVKLVNQILLEAIKKGASDIHFESYAKEYRIRYRQDGILHKIATPPISLSTRITARIKIMSHMDISEKRIPQDGGFKMRLSGNRSIDFRVSICPTVDGEKVVIRILDPEITQLNIDLLGLSSHQKEHFICSIKRPQGMILVTGPTGSGKTATMYAALNLLNTPEVNISTVEDPVEMNISGINQVNINLKTGLTFSRVLRAFLRQDPDIIMVGEIRDLETAEIAVKAAQTGHLVLSTLHTNSAAETLDRLVNMGISTINIVNSISLIIAQRLVRKLCEHCKMVRNDITDLELLKLGFNEIDVDGIKLYKAVGCSKCSNGYRNRIGLFEVLPMTKTLAQLIMSGGNSIDILKSAQVEKISTLYQSGLKKIKEGITTIEEVNRVTVD